MMYLVMLEPIHSVFYVPYIDVTCQLGRDISL